MRVAVYARVSSEDQAERGTIENQVEFATKYCDLHELDIVGWYKDDGVTGTLPLEQREAGRQLLQDAKEQLFETVLIYKLDRLGRSARIILNAVHDLETLGVKVRSMTEPFDTGDASGRFLLTILAGVADLERENILARMSAGADRAAREGKWLGGIVPYGYYVNNEGYLEVSEEPLPGFEMSEADVIRLIYRLTVDQHMSTVEIADYLNALGIPPAYVKDEIKSGKRKRKTAGIWYPGRIRNLLVNTTYKGIHRYGKRATRQREIIEREVPAIVSSDVWARAQAVLREHQIEAMRSAKGQYLLRSLIKCSECGCTYMGTYYGGGRRKGYYVCLGKHAYRGAKLGKCQSKNLPQKWIEDIVWNDCRQFILNPGTALSELTAIFEQRRANVDKLEEEIALLRQVIATKAREKDRVLDLYRRGLINVTDVETQLDSVNRETSELKTRIRHLENRRVQESSVEQDYASAEEFLSAMREALGDGEPPFDVKRKIVKALVQRITVRTLPGTGKRLSAEVTIDYCFATGVTRTDNRAENTYGLVLSHHITLAPGSRCILPLTDRPGDRIRRARLARGWTIRELADAVGMSDVAIGHIELGKRVPAVNTLRKLSTALEQPVWYLSGIETLPENTLGQRVRKARLILGMTKTEFAQQLGVDIHTLMRWERNQTVPADCHLERLLPYLQKAKEALKAKLEPR